jgi:gliding motility-associated-like protein
VKYLLTILTILPFIASSQTCYDTAYNKFVYTPDLIENGNTTICYGSRYIISTRGLGQQWCSNLNLRNGRDTIYPTKDTAFWLYSIKHIPNNIVNGSFSQGNTGFQSDYSVGDYTLYNEAYYNVVSNPKVVHPAYGACVDHSGTAVKNMMVVNGSTHPNKRVWYQTVTIQPNTWYELSYWAQNVALAPTSKLVAYIDGVPISDTFFLGLKCEWLQQKTHWYNTSKTSAVISIVDHDLAAGENDFAIDDISLTGTRYEMDFLNVGVFPFRTVTDTIRGCNLPRPTGVYRDTFRTSTGCDTLIKITVVENYTIQPITKICFYHGCNSYTLNGVTYVRDTIAKDTIKTSGGCDSIYVENHITIEKITPITKIDTVSTCAGFLNYNGVLYINPTLIILDTIRSKLGCDSLYPRVFINLSQPTKYVSTILFACTPITHSGTIYTSYTLLVDTLKNKLGCDSLISIVEIIPGKAPRIIRDTTFTCTPTTNTSDTLKNELGCDTLIRHNVYVTPPIKRDTVNQTICAGQSFHGYNQTGTYRDSVKYASGCDSLITILYLTVKPVYTMVTATFMCAGGMVILPWGDTIKSPGVYKDTIRYKTGCDSLRSTITVTLKTTTNVTIPLNGCGNYTLPTGQVVTSSGVYRQTYRYATGGCDSLVKNYVVTIREKPSIKISKTNDINCTKGFTQLTVTGATDVLWDNNSRSTSITVNPDKTTTYKVRATINGCIVSDSIVVHVTRLPGTASIELPNAFTPNGDGKNDCFSVRTLGNVTNLQFSIYNRWGERVYYTTNPSDCWDGKWKGIPQGTAAFVYVVTGESSCGRIDSKGTLVLIK